LKSIELAIRQEFAPVLVEQMANGITRVWVSMDTSAEDIESACSVAGIAPHHVNLATALWSNNRFDRSFDNELGYVIVRAAELEND
jgi:hypothetical protein